jgi:hypothetical protein
MIEFLVENWHLVVFGIVILFVLVFEALHKPTDLKMERMVRALVILFATYGVAWVTQQIRENQEKHTDYLIKITRDKLALAADNNYAKGLLDELEQRLNKFEHRSSEAAMETDVRSQLIHALRTSNRSAWFLDHYVLVWAESGNPEFDENKLAIKRGVEVRRVFVLSESLLQSQEDLRIAFRVMDEQRKIGVRVFFVLQRDLQRYPEYQRHADVNYGVFDTKLLAKISARASPKASPTYCLLSWEPSVLAQDNPQLWLESTSVISEYSDNSKIPLFTKQHK